VIGNVKEWSRKEERERRKEKAEGNGAKVGRTTMAAR
jgi:hypothetical protein